MPYLFTREPKSCDLGTACLLDRGEDLGPEVELDSAFGCDVFLEDERQGADPEAP